MRYQYLIALALIFVIAVSGCVEGMPDVLKQMMGQKTGGEIKEAPADIITTQNTNTIPTPPIYADGEFTVSFEVFNQDDIKEIEGVKVYLYDTGMCDERTSDTVNPLSTGKELVPQQTEYVEFKFDAPSNQEIGGMEAECPIRYKISYSFDAISQTDLQVISRDKLEALQRAGQAPTFTSTQSIGRGPIKIYFDFGATLPVRTSICKNNSNVEVECTSSSVDTDKSSFSILPLFILVEDKGSGIFGDIPANKLSFDISNDFKVSSCEKFTCTEVSGKLNCKNNQPIPMVKKKSPQIRCSFIVPGKDKVPVDKTYYIKAEMSYDYALYEDLSVAIKPTLEK